MKRLVLSILLQLTPLIAQADFPLRQEGELSTVYLCEVSNLQRPYSSTNPDRALHAIESIFLVSRSLSADGNFTLKKSVSAFLDEVAYSNLEPNIVINDVDAYAENLSKWKVEDATTDKALFMKIRFFGDHVPDCQELVLKLSVGWGKQIEEFAFQIDRDSLDF